VGGPADFFLRPTSAGQIQQGLAFARAHNIPVTIIGYGTNLLVRDGGVRGLVIQIADSLATAQVKGLILTVSAGCLFGSVSKLAAFHGLTGLEFAVGIPGGLGGAVFMNAGAYEGEIGPLVKQVRWVSADKIGEWNDNEYTYSYRHSRVQEEPIVVAGATIELQKGDPLAIWAKMEEFQERRRDKQPLEYPSAGSTFKRPKGHYVGPLIEQANLKGFSIGGAQVSTKHAGFIVNIGGAVASDFTNLISHIQQKIKSQFGVDLETEVRIIGED